ncbi:MAG: hypothetical protein ACFFDV_12715 [Candidatus Thorarchaeota archaeon]
MRLEPIGTITNYFPFLEEETIDVLKAIMEKASDYYDFVVRLGNKACDEDVSIELAYIAALHVYRADEWSLQDRLREKFTDTPEVLVWTFSYLIPDTPLNRDKVSEVLSRAIEKNPPDWMLMDLYYNIGGWLYNNQSELSELVNTLASILNNNPNLACFESYLSNIQSWIHYLEGDGVLSFLVKQRALELAKKVDDFFSVISRTGDLAHMLKDHNALDALEFAEEYNRLGMLSGLPRKMETARHVMGLIHAVRGEYDMAVECQVAAYEVCYHDKGPTSNRCAIASLFSSDIEDGRQALHWANESFRTAGGKGDALMHYAMLRALLLLGRLEDTDHHLDKLHKLSLTSANEPDQAQFLYGRGLYELKSGNPRAAIESLEQALSINEQLNSQIGINRCLIALTEAEIQIAGESGEEDTSGPWMVRLESHARKKDYPGIQMHAALLRAEFLVKQGRKEKAHEVLQDALDILDSSTVKTLRTRIQKMLDDLIIA